jgi:hypothetical protein
MSDFRPLSEFALGVLQEIRRKPLPRQKVNSGVARRLEEEALVEVYSDPSPYKKHSRSVKIQWLKITAAGEKRLEEWKAAK